MAVLIAVLGLNTTIPRCCGFRFIHPGSDSREVGHYPTLYRWCLLFLSPQLFSFHPCPVLCSFKFSFHPRQASEVMSLFNCSYFKRSSPATNENKPGSRRAVRLSFWLQNSWISGALLWDESDEKIIDSTEEKQEIRVWYMDPDRLLFRFKLFPTFKWDLFPFITRSTEILDFDWSVAASMRF